MNALQFSGGLDSLAVLWLLRNQWPDLHVFWLNTGAAYPSTVEYMQRVRELVPHFHEVRSDQPLNVEVFGWPVDVVPVGHTKVGLACTGGHGRMYQSYLDCCGANIWLPMQHAMRLYGVTDVYRGQRNDERHKAPIRDGHVEAGITYHFPIAAWSRNEVVGYCRRNCPEWMPPYYAAGERTSRDCWSCTAYLDDNHERIDALPLEQRALVQGVVADWHADVLRELKGERHG